MEPQIRYATTSDGVRIAYYAIGQGPPLLVVQLPNTHTKLEWQVPALRALNEATARATTLVRMDFRGFGLSDREIINFPLESLVLDIETVTDKLALERFWLFGAAIAVPAAIKYTAEHRDRVTHLILAPAAERGSDLTNERLEQLRELARIDWGLASEAIERSFSGWDDEERSRPLAAMFREATNPQTLNRLVDCALKWEFGHLLPSILAPTLLIHNTGDPNQSTDVTRRVAAALPNARVSYVTGPDEVPQAIVAFLTETYRPIERSAITPPSGTAIILFADIVDSTALTERLGDAAFRPKARELGVVLRALIRECGGTPVEGPTLGDGVLAVFTSAREAIEGARRCARAGDEAGLPLHLGLHAGDVSREKDPDGRDNVYGGAVNIASRISGLSAPGEVLVSETVRSLARTSAGVRFEDRGEQALKGVGEAVRVWAVQPQP